MMKTLVLFTIICVSQFKFVSAFVVSSSSFLHEHRRSITTKAESKCWKGSRNEFNHRLMAINVNNGKTRRDALSFVYSAAGLLSSVSFSSPAVAKTSELFKPNPLTNGFLEKMRILEQAEADNLQYNGELAPGSSPERAAYAKMLVPILVIRQDIDEVDKLVHNPDGEGLDEAEIILSKPAFEKKTFKKTFNAFADNIYYSDPDRANLYLGGGATPKNEQSIAYLLRNEILTNIENLQAEVTYLIKERKAANPIEVEDLYLYTKLAKDGMKKYVELVPPSELIAAEKTLSSN